MESLEQEIAKLSLGETKHGSIGEKTQHLLAGRHKPKTEVCGSKGLDAILGLISWNYKHESSKAGLGGSEKTKNALKILVEDDSVDIFSMQELLWTKNLHDQIYGKEVKSGKPYEFSVIHTFDESGFYFNSSMLKCEKISHAETPETNKDTFEFAWNNRVCIGKFTYKAENHGELEFYGVSYHGPHKVGNHKKEDFRRKLFERIRNLQETRYQSPFFITGDFNMDIQNLKVQDLKITLPDEPKRDPIDFMCVLNTNKSQWEVSLHECVYEKVEPYEGASTHPPIFAYLGFKRKL